MYRFILLGLFLACSTLHAQLVEFSDFDSTSTEGVVETELFDQASLGFSSSNPTLSLKTFKLAALIGNQEWDFYVFNSTPAFSIPREDTAQVLSDGILNQIGGLANIALSKVAYFANGHDKLNRDFRGAQLDFRLGGKLLDAQNRTEGNDFLVPILQSSLDLRYLIPLVQSSQETEGSLRDRMRGNLSFRIYGTAMQILRSDVYDRVFIDERGNKPSHSILTGNIEVNLFITDQFYLSVGHTISTEQRLPNRTFFSVSFMGQ